MPHEKLMIARLLLEELKVDRVEVASARVSEGEFDAVKMICDWEMCIRDRVSAVREYICKMQ